MNKFLALTTIFPPSEAVEKFSKIADWQIVVAGDKKTPEDWHCNGVKFLSINDQLNSDVKLLRDLPQNHYCRKMAAYIFAIKNSADIIAETDDDNIPLSNWGFPDFDGIYSNTSKNLGFINIYNFFTDQKIWPRGLPLNKINSDLFSELLKIEETKIGFWQGLADDDPDVDAVYRLVFDNPCKFIHRAPVILNSGTFSPTNTQNTCIRKELFPLLYLPSTVSFRFTDILRGIVSQPVMQAAGYKTGFISSTVYQKRNPHDYMKDFAQEIEMYQKSESALTIASNVSRAEYSVSDNLYNVYSEYVKAGITKPEELNLLQEWLKLF